MGFCAHGRQAHRRCGGFSLVEAIVSIVIVGVGIFALMTSAGSSTRIGANSQEGNDAALLAQEMYELVMAKTFDDVLLLDGTAYSPPRSGSGSVFPGFVGWTQKISVSNRNPANPTTSAPAGTTGAVYVKIEVLRGGRTVLSTGLLVMKRS